MPVLLLALTLALNYALRAAVERNQALIQAEMTQRVIAAGEEAAPTPEEPVVAVPAQLETTLAEERNAATLAYLSRLEEPRARLRGAIESYRNATSRPGGSSIIHATSAQRLRDEIEQAYAVIAAAQPPDALAEAHALYLQGLELEVTALDHMLAFYSSFSRRRRQPRRACNGGSRAPPGSGAPGIRSAAGGTFSGGAAAPFRQVMVVSQQYAGCAVHCVSTMRNSWLFVISEHPQLFFLFRMKCTDDDKRVRRPFVIL
jgi:hypothetical protein